MDDELVRAVVTAATRAPSLHNSQPWRFVARADTVELWADRSRALPVLDPDGRALHVSCGAALAMAQTYVRALGRATRVTLLPDAGQPEHLADLVVGDFEGEDRTALDEVRALADAIPRRHTDRRPFDPRPVPADALHALARAAESQGCWLKVVDSVDDAATVAVTLARAEATLEADPAYLDELRRWTGRPAGSPDGVPAGAVPAEPAAYRGSSFRLREFDADRLSSPSVAHPDDPPTAEHPLVVVLGSVGDDPSAWLEAGRALGVLLLTAAAHGLATSPMTQALEIADTRARLTQDLGLVGHPQMVLRVGIPAAGAPAAAAARRPVDEVLARA